MTTVASRPAASWPWLKSYPPGIDWRMEFKPRPLYRLLDDAAARFGDKPCIDFLDRRWSFTDVKALSDRFARGLVDQGVRPATRTGQPSTSSPEGLIACTRTAREVPHAA